jgi:protein-L-isoaspartate(D-aspartate) O-methyltransferase
MVETIVALARSPTVLRDSDGLDASILGAMREVPRHELVPEDVRPAAYANRPLPIGYGQTISQPFIVALMTDLARPDKDDVVLEIGTGSGYQAAVLSRLVDRVYSIEIVEPLARRATERLHSLGYNNITVRQGDGYHGWPEHAPFDAILVTAAASHIPPPLVGQLKPGGRMVIPVGPAFMAQNLMLVEKDSNGKVQTRVLLPVSFVPLTGSGSR